ncbi:GntR family transcriptional regulator [Streptosporangium sp. NPDC048865]|uniref:GntR family transcriptional regulator n=1 Tax=Streptosporangium sp. NPDC048865 TaxID=3155766 RepID=UPI00343726E9
MAVGGEPPYKVIARALAGDIDSGGFEPGEKLPSEAELQRRFEGVSRDTVRAALGELARIGLTATQSTVGTFVRSYDRKPAPLAAVVGGREVGASVDIRVVPPPAPVAELLPGETSVWWRRTLGELVVDSYYPRAVADRVPELTEPTVLQAPDALLAQAGIVVADRRVRHVSRMPTMAEEALLGTPPGTSLGEVLVALVDAEGRTVAVRAGTFRGDRFFIEHVL